MLQSLWVAVRYDMVLHADKILFGASPISRSVESRRLMGSALGTTGPGTFMSKGSLTANKSRGPSQNRRSALPGFYVPVPLTGISTLAAPWRIPKNPVRAPLAGGVKVTATV